MKKRSLCLLLATILASIYFLGIVSYFLEDIEFATGAIASLIVAPHILATGLGVLFGWIAFFARSSGFALASAIMYCVASIIFVMYAMFLIPSIVLGFIGYGRVKKLNHK